MNKLPIYFLIDTKSEIGGESLSAMNNGMKMLISDLKQNPRMIETAILSINSLSENNFQINPLIDLNEIENCELIATQSCCLGKAISLICESLQKEKLVFLKDKKENFKPIVFIYLTNNSEDNFVKFSNHFRDLCHTTVVVKFGSAVNDENLHVLTENILNGGTMDSSDIYKFFQWSENIFSYSGKATSSAKNEINLKKL